MTWRSDLRRPSGAPARDSIVSVVTSDAIAIGRQRPSGGLAPASGHRGGSWPAATTASFGTALPQVIDASHWPAPTASDLIWSIMVASLLPALDGAHDDVADAVRVGAEATSWSGPGVARGCRRRSIDRDSRRSPSRPPRRSTPSSPSSPACGRVWSSCRSPATPDRWSASTSCATRGDGRARRTGLARRHVAADRARRRHRAPVDQATAR